MATSKIKQPVKKARSMAVVPQEAVVLKTARTAAEKRADTATKAVAGKKTVDISEYTARSTADLEKILRTSFPVGCKWSTDMLRGVYYITVFNRVGRKIGEIKSK